MKKVSLSLLIAVMAGAAFFSGCQKKEIAKDGTVTITVGGWPAMDRAFGSNMAAFTAKYPNIKVEFALASTPAHHQSLQTALAAGSGIHDVDMIEAEFIAQYRDSLALEDLKQAPYNAERLKNDFTAYKWDQAYSSDGKRFVAIPWDIGPMGFFYRADIFAEVGLPSEPAEVAEYMSSWDNFLNIARKVHIPGKRWLVFNAADCYKMFFRNQDYFDEKLNFKIDRPNDIACLNAVIAMRKEKLDMNSGSDAESNAAWADGSLLSHAEAAWWESGLKHDLAPDQAGKWRITTLPGGHPSLNSGGSYLCIPAKGEHKEEAWAFVEFMLANAESQNNMMKIGYFPAYIPAWNDPLYDLPDPFYGGQPAAAMWKAIALELNVPKLATIMDNTADDLIMNSINEGLEKGLNAQGIKDLLRTNVETAVAEEKRQQIDIFRSIGMWQ